VINERRTVHNGVGTRELFVEGDGPTVVLLHGFGHPADAWRPALNRFAEAGQSAVAVDLPGFGAADPAAPGAWLPQGDRFVADVVAAYSQQAPVVLVGNSLGAYLAVRAAASPLRLPTGGIVPTATPGFGWTALVRAAFLGDGRPLTWVAGVSAPRWIRECGADTLISHFLYGDRTLHDPELVRILSAQVHSRRGARELLERAVSMKCAVDAEPAVVGASCPAIFVHGRRDRIVAVASSEGWHNATPGSRLVVLDKAGHCPQLDAPDEIVALVSELVTAARRDSRPA
jgi:pimeloyl-ACP methyl ester carboxylesterase